MRAQRETMYLYYTMRWVKTQVSCLFLAFYSRFSRVFLVFFSRFSRVFVHKSKPKAQCNRDLREYGGGGVVGDSMPIKTRNNPILKSKIIVFIELWPAAVGFPGLPGRKPSQLLHGRDLFYCSPHTLPPLTPGSWGQRVIPV